MGKKNGQRISKKPWNPTAEGLAIYEAFEFGDKTLAELAKQEGVIVSTISMRCTKIRNWLAKQAVESVEEQRHIHTHRLINIHYEAMRAWKRSLEDAEEITRTTKDGAADSVKTKGQSGNPALLAQARGALQDIRNIWGVDEIVKGERDERNNDRPIITVVVATKEQADGIYQASQLSIEHKDAEP